MDHSKQHVMIGRTVGHYRITDRLGSGGMGVVYRAEDVKLARTVALKFLPPELTRDPEANQRFEREARAASQLDHPNICTVHEFGESEDGQMFLAMACYDGESLAARIARGPVPLAEAIRIVEQIARGLGKAHASGIVHRDVKPANVMVTNDGVVKVLDFGLAKLALASSITQSHTTVGTASYMAPEQIRAENVGPQADIWALGVVLFELLTGRHPFRGESPGAMLYSILNDSPPSVSEHPEVDPIVRRMLEKDPRQRYQSTDEVLRDLERLRSGASEVTVRRLPPPRKRTMATGAVVVAALAIAVVGWLEFSRHNAPQTIRSIAVLPFRPLDDRHADRAIELGIADTVINKLSQLPGLVVTPTRTIARFLDQTTDPLAAGRQLHVDAVLEANIQREPSRVRCSVRLLRVADGTSIWADQYDQSSSDTFALEDDIAQRVAGSLDLRLGHRERQALMKRYTDNPAAYQLYQQGRYAWSSFKPEGLMASVGYFQAALQKDPKYALAYSGLAGSYTLIGIYGPLSRDEAFARAREAAVHALELDPDLPQAHWNMAAIKIFRDWEWEAAEAELRRAIDLNPNTMDPWNLLGYVQEAKGDPESALRSFQRARSLDPSWFIIQRDCLHGQFLARHYDATIQEGTRLLAATPSDAFVRGLVARAMAAKGLLDDAGKQAQIVHSQDARRIAPLGMIAAQRGDRAGVAQAIAELEKRRLPDGNTDYQEALIYSAAGDRDRTFQALDAALRVRYPSLWSIHVDPVFDAVRGDPRYSVLLAKMNLRESEFRNR